MFVAVPENGGRMTRRKLQRKPVKSLSAYTRLFTLKTFGMGQKRRRKRVAVSCIFYGVYNRPDSERPTKDRVSQCRIFLRFPFNVGQQKIRHLDGRTETMKESKYKCKNRNWLDNFKEKWMKNWLKNSFEELAVKID